MEVYNYTTNQVWFNVVDMGFVEVNVNKYKVSKYLNIYNPIAMKN
jgi:hypothetical protein